METKVIVGVGEVKFIEIMSLSCVGEAGSVVVGGGCGLLGACGVGGDDGGGKRRIEDEPKSEWT